MRPVCRVQREWEEEAEEEGGRGGGHAVREGGGGGGLSSAFREKARATATVAKLAEDALEALQACARICSHMHVLKYAPVCP